MTFHAYIKKDMLIMNEGSHQNVSDITFPLGIYWYVYGTYAICFT